MRDYSRYSLSPGEKLKYISMIAAASLLAGLLFYDTPWTVAAALPVYMLLRSRICRMKAGAVRKQLLGEYKDLLYSLSASFASGRHMEEAIKEAGPVIESIYGPESILRPELDHMLIGMLDQSADETDLWQDLASRSGLEDIRDFADLLANCRETGGDLRLAAQRAAELITEKISVERGIAVMVSQKRFEGRLIGVMPVLMIAFLRLTSPEYISVMYSGIGMRVLMSAALAAMGLSVWMSERICRIDV